MLDYFQKLGQEFLYGTSTPPPTSSTVEPVSNNNNMETPPYRSTTEVPNAIGGMTQHEHLGNNNTEINIDYPPPQSPNVECRMRLSPHELREALVKLSQGGHHATSKQPKRTGSHGVATDPTPCPHTTQRAPTGRRYPKGYLDSTPQAATLARGTGRTIIPSLTLDFISAEVTATP